MPKPKAKVKQKAKKRKTTTTKTKIVSPVQKALARLKKIKGFANIANNPLKFRTSNGNKIVVLKHGFSNIYKGQKNTSARAFVIAFVNGKKIFFYRSSGEVSGKQGQWFPTQGPIVHSKNGSIQLGWLTKMKGHPKQRNPTGNPPNIQEMKKYGKRPYFPKQVSEIRAKIKAMENQLELHSEWGTKHYLLIANAFEKVPFSGEIRQE